MWRRFLQIIIPLFCLWHMSAVALYLLPDRPQNPVLRYLAGSPKNFIRPYILFTSQWQKWDIFSPNPQRQVSIISIDRQQGGNWETIVQLDRDHLPTHIKVKELKILSRLTADWKGAAPDYLRAWCRELNMPNATLRLAMRFYVIPLPADVHRMGGWSQWKPQLSTNIISTIRCPSAPQS